MNGKNKCKSKGFIGAIGDDLPSLIPIIFALVLFFAVFGYSLDVFHQKTDFMQMKLSGLQIASTIKQNSLLSGEHGFLRGCSKVTQREYNYVAVLLRGLDDDSWDNFGEADWEFDPQNYEKSPSVSVDFIKDNGILDSGVPIVEDPNTGYKFFCSNLSLDSSDNSGTADSIDQELGKLEWRSSFVTYTYPVGIQLTDNDIHLARLVVMVWK